MKSKTLVWAYLLILSLGTILSLYIPKNAAVAKESVVIPGDAIRLRILANSDLESDQALKRNVRDAVNAKITVWVKDLTSLQKAKAVIKSKLPELQATAEQVVHEHGSNQSVKVQFGKVQFPTKLYGEFLYPAGEYQAVLITLGKGAGANWWCVLYPPLCFLDFSNGVAVSDGFEDQKAKAVTVEPATSKADQQVSAAASSAVDSSSIQEADTGKDQASVATATNHGTQTPAGANNVSSAADSNAGAYSSASAGRDISSSAAGQFAGQDHPSSAGSLSADQDSPSSVTDGPAQDSPSAGKITQSADSSQAKQTSPVYTQEDEQPVKVKFFIVELFQKLFQ